MGDNNYASISFDRYDDEFQILVQQIEKGLKEDPPSSYSTNLFQQANDLIKQMALEARSVPDIVEKRTLLDKVRVLKDQISALQNEVNKKNLLYPPSSSSGAGGADHERLVREQKLRQQQQTEHMLLGQNDTLERARRTMEETETIALEITEELGQNREKLMSAHGRIREVSGLTGRARSILHAMNQRNIRHKMILYGVAGTLCLGFLFLLWSVWG